MAIPILTLIDLSDTQLARFEADGYQVHDAIGADAPTLRVLGEQSRAVITNGSTGLSALQMDQLPKLEVVCVQGAGYENIDFEAAAHRGIPITNGPGTNDRCVAEHAIALLLSLVRDIPAADRAVRAGQWSTFRWMRPTICRKRLGILGMGRIGGAVAKHGRDGFDMEIGYCNRNPIDGCADRYFPNPIDLAHWCDALIVATPGGRQTLGMVDRNVLTALGPNGYLVNVARGSVVDTLSLIEALRSQGIAGAALDVIDGEPDIPPETSNLDNLIFTPHIAGRSPESNVAKMEVMMRNITAHFRGDPLPNPVR